MHSLNCSCAKCQSNAEWDWEDWEMTDAFGESEWGGPFSEAEEMELAAELLSISSEQELDMFLGGLFKKAWKGLKKVGRFVGKVAKPLGGVLRNVAKAALPVVGGALGSFIPIPGVGTAVGSALGRAVSSALEMEYGDLAQEDMEFEVARRFVRIAGTAAQNAAQMNPSDPQAAVRQAVIAAARQHVPNLKIGQLSPASTGMMDALPTGRWVRKGRVIVLHGA